MKKLMFCAGLLLMFLTGCHGSRYVNGAASAYNQRYLPQYNYCQETPQQRAYQDQMLFYEAARYQQMLDNNRNAVNLKHRY